MYVCRFKDRVRAMAEEEQGEYLQSDRYQSLPVGDIIDISRLMHGYYPVQTICLQSFFCRQLCGASQPLELYSRVRVRNIHHSELSLLAKYRLETPMLLS